ncbi:LAMI_0H02564g1_1 [Lachancea mirantina]|uniref:LAMI_0H02564g1_1 n=1 Tax=Lachancea mirantina TaxID=1230905 RepID=A0A1G4KE06_9SACH|nr:LAMI_0H02564g1_1 [Lachancea mirantina]
MRRGPPKRSANAITDRHSESLEALSPADRVQGQGLNVELHPALRSANYHLVGRDANPYLAHEKRARAEEASGILKRYEKGLQFRVPGSITSRVQKQREDLAKREKASQQAAIEEQQKILSGELPDKIKGEEKYLHQEPPFVEWWDLQYLKDQTEWIITNKYTRKYDNLEEDSDEDDDSELERPSIRFVQHPVPFLPIPDDKKPPRVFLTKMEHRKVRRNNRKLLREEYEQKIRAGVKPKPEPKVKLSNMMSVYQNSENITDPTSWEKTVRQQVESRRLQHLETNEIRHQEALAAKLERPKSAPAEGQLCCKVWRFKSIRNPKIRYKLATNSRQLGLRGICLHVRNGAGLIVVLGSDKNCRFYDKLVRRRIKWDETFVDNKTDEEIEELNNCAELVWEGYLRDTKFRGWFMKQCNEESELKETLERYDAAFMFSLLVDLPITNANAGA